MTNGDGRHPVRWAPVAARLLLRSIAAGLVIGLLITQAGQADAGHIVMLVCLGLLLVSPVIQIVSYVQAETRHGPRYVAAALAVLALLVYQLISRFRM